MKKILLILMVIGMICIIGCNSPFTENDKNAENNMANQKIVLIYSYLNYNDTPQYRGFYVNNKGDKIPFDLSETAARFQKDNRFTSDNDMYQFLLETQETDSEEFLTPDDVLKCYKLLLKINDNYNIDEKCTGKDMGSYSWQGVLDDGVNPPKFIMLSEKGDWTGINTDRNAKKIMKILEKAE